jgi:hypothetical protein
MQTDWQFGDGEFRPFKPEPDWIEGEKFEDWLARSGYGQTPILTIGDASGGYGVFVDIREAEKEGAEVPRWYCDCTIGDRCHGIYVSTFPDLLRFLALFAPLVSATAAAEQAQSWASHEIDHEKQPVRWCGFCRLERGR